MQKTHSPQTLHTSNVLQEDQWYFSLAAKLNEVSAFHCGLGEQDTIIANDAHRIPI